MKSLLLPGRPAIVESILALARTLNTSVVAEGIESDVQARELERLGCTHAQGFLFSRPLSIQLAEELVMANRPLGPKAGIRRENQPHSPLGTVGKPTISGQRPDAQHATPRLVEECSPLARV